MREPEGSGGRGGGTSRDACGQDRASLVDIGLIFITQLE
jgi:hypothetical protein